MDENMGYPVLPSSASASLGGGAVTVESRQDMSEGSVCLLHESRDGHRCEFGRALSAIPESNGGQGGFSCFFSQSSASYIEHRTYNKQKSH